MRAFQGQSGPKCRLWYKIHIGVDEETLEVRAIQATRSSIDDAPMLPDLINQIPLDDVIGYVTADRACDTRKCHDGIAALHFVDPLIFPTLTSGNTNARVNLVAEKTAYRILSDTIGP